MDSSFYRAPVNVPKLSGFDKSHHNLLTSQPGTITPILIDELIPGSRVNLNLALSASLPPLASDTYMKCSVKVESFFVPFRILCGSFESWFTDEAVQFIDYTGADTYGSQKGMLPTFGRFSSTDASTLASQGYFDYGSLADYLGMRLDSSSVPTIIAAQSFSLMPFLAYQRVYHDWYRNSLIQREVFLRPTTGASSSSPSPYSYTLMAGTMPYFFAYPNYTNISGIPNLSCADGLSVLSLRQRNFGLDYFTTATPTAQQGSAEVVTFSTSGSTGQFSIAALRAANSMQQFKERNNLAGNQYVEQLYARYGVRPSDGVAQRSLYLGGAEYECYSKGVFQTAMDPVTPSGSNPFSATTGAQFGHARASGSSHIADFEAKEPGYLLVCATLVPRVSYSTGVHRRFMHYIGAGSLADLANPILQNVGPQPIYQYELNGNVGSNGIFGYTDRYAEFKTMDDELHGNIRDGGSLQSFALQRSFAGSSTPTINDAFLKIPQNYMDQVTAVSADISNYGCWMDMYLDYKVSQPLAKYSLPSLQDPAYEHGRTIVVNRGGFKL